MNISGLHKNNVYYKFGTDVDIYEPLNFTALTDNTTIKLNKVGNPSVVNLLISSNGHNRFPYTIGTSIVLKYVGDKIYFKSSSIETTEFSNNGNYYTFAITGSVDGSGDVTSLIRSKGTDILKTEYCFNRLFYNCTALRTAPNLPSHITSNYCYYQMFLGCSNLTQCPEILATEIGAGSCTNMFYNCTGLTSIPRLYSTELKEGCYQGMFRYCSSLKLSTTKTSDYQTEYRIPNSGTGTTATSAMKNMFANTGGTFAGAPVVNTTYYTSNLLIPYQPPTPITTPGIYRDETNGLISLSSDGTTWLTIADKNLGATSTDITSTDSYGYMFQWGNNYGFSPTGTISSISTSAVNVTPYGPSNYYSSSTWRNKNPRWISSPYSSQLDLWGNTTNTYIARKGPCEDGFHIPTNDELRAIISIMGTFNQCTKTGFGQYLKAPITNSRGHNSSIDTSYGIARWGSGISSPADCSSIVGQSTGKIITHFYNFCDYGLSIRPFSNTAVQPNSSRTKLY